MSKVFRYLFRKRDCKDGNNNGHTDKEDTRGTIRIEAGRDEMAKRNGARRYSPMRRRTSDSLSNDPVYVNRLLGINNEGTIRLFKEATEEKHHFPDNEPKYIRKENNHGSSISKNINNLHVYTTSVENNSSCFNPPSASRPSEPFPYKVYNSPPRRSTLHYGVDYEDKPLNSDEHQQFSVRKGVDGNYSSTSTSQNDDFNHSDLQNIQDDKERSLQQGRRVTIVTPKEMGDIPLVNNYDDKTNDLETGNVRKTILRFRPHSSASRNPRESVKLMVFRSDQIENPPMVLSRHVHQFPLKRIKRTPVLMTADGCLLKPLDTDKQVRSSLKEKKDESHIRLSIADIENICKVQRKSTEIVDPVFTSRNSMNRRISNRQSSISRQIVNEKRNSFLRESSEEPKLLYHYSMEENKPLVYGVPITPPRNRSISHISRQSVTSNDFINYLKYDSEGTCYYTDESKPINEEVQYSRDQPDCITVKNDKPIVVYEVHNYKNNNLSVSKTSTPKNKDTGKIYIKSQRNSAQTNFIKKQPMEVEIIDQESNTQLQPIHIIKEKQSFKNKITSQKSSENYIHDSSPKYHQQPIVYVAEVTSGTLPDPKHETRKHSFKEEMSRTTCSTTKQKQSNDFCGLACEPQEKSDVRRKNSNSNFKMVSSYQQTDFENDIDFLCYPAEKLSKTPINLPKSNSKLKWRIIIKKQENK